MQINRIVIENLRAIEKLELKLADEAGVPRRRVILLGVNGAGKTTILDALAHTFVYMGDRVDEAVLRAADVRNVEEPSLAADAPRRRGAVTLDVVLSQSERRVGRRLYSKAPARGQLRFQIGTEASEDVLEDYGIQQSRPEDGVSPRSSEIEDVGVEQEQDDIAGSFAGAARAALAVARSPCILLPADRGVLEPGDDLSLREIRNFDTRHGSLSRSRDRFAPIAARLALATISTESELGRSVGRMWKALKKYFPALPMHVADENGLSLRFRNERGAIIPLTSLSEGERAVLLIFGELALRAPGEALVLIDELEQHLHPRWQRAALAALAALLPSAQFVFTTQSPYLAACAPDDVITLGDWKTDGE